MVVSREAHSNKQQVLQGRKVKLDISKIYVLIGMHEVHRFMTFKDEELYISVIFEVCTVFVDKAGKRCHSAYRI